MGASQRFEEEGAGGKEWDMRIPGGSSAIYQRGV